MELESFFTHSNAPLDTWSLVINLIIGFLLSLILRYHFKHFGSTLSNREEFAQVFPFILMTTLLIISIVKSSLALSLGLVGALSIVRFRTPIKEPEELAYLFIAIAIGLGLGANQTLATIVGTITILGLMALLGIYKYDKSNKNLYLSIDWTETDEAVANTTLAAINTLISKHTLSSDLRRFDIRDGSIETTYFVDLSSSDSLFALTQELKEEFPNLGLTFLDQNQLPSV